MKVLSNFFFLLAEMKNTLNLTRYNVEKKICRFVSWSNGTNCSIIILHSKNN